MEGKALKNTIRLLLLLNSLWFAAAAAYGAREPLQFRLGDTVLVCPIADPQGETRTVLQLLSKGRFDKARQKLAALRLNRKAHPEADLLAGLADFLDGTDREGKGLEAMLDPAAPLQTQILAELALRRGETLRALTLYAGLKPELLSAQRLDKRLKKVQGAFLDAFGEAVDQAVARGEFEALSPLVEKYPAGLPQDARYAKAAFILACVAENAGQAQMQARSLSTKDREVYGDLVTALELEPSLKLSFFQKAGKDRLADPLWQMLYIRALDTWLIGNMPLTYQAAHASTAVTQRDLALLLCLYFPALKGAAPEDAVLPPGLLDDPEADCLSAVIALGVFPSWDGAAVVPGETAVRALARALESAGMVSPCGATWNDYVHCDLIPAHWNPDHLSGEQIGILAHKMRGEL
jgi:hypothetical protein